MNEQDGGEIAWLCGHEDWVRSVAFSPDGRRLASASDDGTIRVWDAGNGRPLGGEIACLRGHEGSVRSVAFSPDGRRLASASEDGTIRVWDAGKDRPLGGEIACLRGHEDVVMSVAFSPDGRRLASASYDHTIRIWDAGNGRPLGGEIACLRGHEGEVLSVAFSPDGCRLASGSNDGTIRVWDAGNGRPLGGEIACLRGHEGVVLSVAFSPDGRRLASGSGDGTIRVWHAGNGRPLGGEIACLRGHERWVLSVAFSPDGRRLASASEDGTIRVWDAGNGRPLGGEIACLRGHEDGVLSVAFSPDGRRLASGSNDGTISLWDTSAWLGVPAAASGPLAAWISRQAASVGRRVRALAQPDDWLPRLPCDEVAGCLGRLRPEDSDPLIAGSVALSLDGRWLYAGTARGAVIAWDVPSGQALGHSRAHNGVVYDIALSADGRRLASGSSDRTIRVWDAGSGGVIGGEIACLRGHEFGVRSVAFSPDGRRLASGSEDGTIRLWDTTSSGRGEIACLRGHEDLVMSVAFSPDGRRLASGSPDGTIRVWQAGTDSKIGSEIACLRGHEGGIWSVAFSPDGSRLASGSFDGTIRVWDAGSGRPVGGEIACLRGHQHAVLTVAFSPDGRRLASGSHDSTIRLWDVASGAELQRFAFREGPCWRLAWAPSGAFLVSASGGDTFRLWDTRTAAAALPAASAGDATLPPALARLPMAWLSLHRLGVAAPLSLLADLDALLRGEDPPAFAALKDDAGLNALQQLHWRHVARYGLLALLLHDWPQATAWQPPAGESSEGGESEESGESGERLRQALATALAGEPCAPQPDPPPLAFLQQRLARVDDRLLALLVALGENAVGADPGLPLRALAEVGKLPRLSLPQRQLLGLRLAPLDAGPAQGSGSGLDRSGLSQHGPITALAPSQLALPRPLLCWRYLNGGLLYRARSGREAPRLRPTLILLDTSPACWGPIEHLTRPAAYALANTLAADGLPALFLVASELRVHPLADPLGRLALLTERSRQPAEALAALAKARALRQSLIDGALEPIILLLTHAHWGADLDRPAPVPGLRALFVQYPQRFVAPPWASCCERAETIAHDDLSALPATLGRLIG